LRERGSIVASHTYSGIRGHKEGGRVGAGADKAEAEESEGKKRSDE
jgi:hypothetical protein